VNVLVTHRCLWSSRCCLLWHVVSSDRDRWTCVCVCVSEVKRRRRPSGTISTKLSGWRCMASICTSSW